MIIPGVLAIAAPVGIGFIGGAKMLGGTLAGVMLEVLLALFMSNAGGAWDNAKNQLSVDSMVEKALRLIKHLLQAIQLEILLKIQQARL